MKKSIVILGGGFGGVYAAVNLEKLMTAQEREEIEIVIVSRENYLVFQPLLAEVLSSSVELNHVIAPIRRLAKTARLYTRDVQSIDLAKRTVTLKPGAKPLPLTIPYDHLVIAVGNRLDYDKIPGMREHAHPFKYLGDALWLRNQLVNSLEEAETETDEEMRRSLLTFVVAGGGFSGVECIAEMNDFLREASRSYHNIKETDLRFVLVQGAERILPEVSEGLAEFAHRLLEKRGVEIQLNARLKAVSAHEAVVEDAKTKAVEVIRTRTTVATIPAGPHSLVTALAVDKERGRIKVDSGMEVPGTPGLWALGDCALVKQVDGHFSPPTAQHALRQSRTCAFNILASLRGGKKRVFKFTGLGTLSSLGHRSAVAEIMGIRLKGLIAWMVWRGVYVTKFPGLDGQLRLVADWILDAFLPRDITELRLFHEKVVAREHFEVGEMVFRAGDFGDKVYFISDGEAAVWCDDKCVATLKRGEMFGEAALLADQSRNASIRAATTLDVVAVKREAFHELLGALPGMRSRIEGIMSERMGRGVDLSAEMGSSSSPGGD